MDIKTQTCVRRAAVGMPQVDGCLYKPAFTNRDILDVKLIPPLTLAVKYKYSTKKHPSSDVVSETNEVAEQLGTTLAATGWEASHKFG